MNLNSLFQVFQGYQNGTQGLTQQVDQESQAKKPSTRLPNTPSTIFLADLPKEISQIELYEFLKEKVGGEVEIIIKRPQMRYFYYAFCRFDDIIQARKLCNEIRFPEIRGKVCRALPFEKDLHLRVSPNAALFVKGLDPKWTHRELYEQFKDFGELLSCKVSIDENHKSRGYGFLQYHKEEQANKAIEAVNGKQLGESQKPLIVTHYAGKEERKKIKPPFNNLFVKAFPNPDFSDEDLKNLFEPYGEILCVRVMRDDEGKSKQFGFVCYKNSIDAQRAMDDQNGKNGLFVCKALKSDERKKEIRKQTERFKKSMIRQNVYVKNIPDNVPDEELLEYFKKFGEVKNMKIIRDYIQKQNSDCNSFGFVSYESQEAASRAKTEAPNLPFKGKFLYINYFEPKTIREAHNQEKIDRKQFEKYKTLISQKEKKDGFEKLSEAMKAKQPGTEQVSALMTTFIAILAYYQQVQQAAQGGQHNGYQGFNNSYQKRYNQRGQGQTYNYGNTYNTNYTTNLSAPPPKPPQYPNPFNPQGQQRNQRRVMHMPFAPRPIPPALILANQPLPPAPISTNPDNDAYKSKLQVCMMKTEFLKGDLRKKREMIGEILYDYIIKFTEDQFVPKITGMILDLNDADFDEAILNLDSLKLKSIEGLKLLKDVETSQTSNGGAGDQTEQTSSSTSIVAQNQSVNTV